MRTSNNCLTQTRKTQTANDTLGNIQNLKINTQISPRITANVYYNKAFSTKKESIYKRLTQSYGILHSKL